MAYQKSFLIFVIAVLNINLGGCAEFVPVYMWSRNKLSEDVPALHKTSQDTFKDTLLEYLKEDPYIIVFAERTLSPEDFAQHDQNGEIAFPNLHNLKKEKNHVIYKPYVQNPIGAIKQLDKPITHISIESLLKSSNVPKDNILIIDLNDAKDDETRFHMLKRHDSDIVSIYLDILKQRPNVLAFYLAYHTSWVEAEELTHTKIRSLLQSETPEIPPPLFNSTNALLYLTSDGLYETATKKINITNDFTYATKIDETGNEITATLTGAGSEKIEFKINYNLTGYWFIKSVSADDVSLNIPKEFYAPKGFSYHCAKLNLTSSDKSVKLVLPGFQIQPNFGNDSSRVMKFGDAYDCVGFTSVPIWSGLFVTAILLFIITFGLSMMMDIRTMDRFDDPKGKTITVTASE